MNNFIYDNYTKILFGRGMEEKTGDELSRLGGKVLLHYGKSSIFKTGLYDIIVASLKSAGIEWVELGGVKPNPLLSKVYEGIELCRSEGVDVILAVGGGSVIDSAKAIAMGLQYKGDVWDFYAGKAVPEKTTPLGVVLTLPGTGSESSFSSVITRDEDLKKAAVNIDLIRPEFAVLNPELAFTLSDYQLACGSFDAMTHIMERYFSLNDNNDCTDRMCEAALQTLVQNIPKILAYKTDYHTMCQIMWASKIAHDHSLGVGRTGDFGSHRIAHELSALYDIAHGASLSIVFPAWIEYNREAKPGRTAQFFRRVFGVDFSFHDEDGIITEGLKRLRSFLREAGLPVSFNELDVEVDIDKMAGRCTAGGPVGNMVKLDRQDVLNIYRIAKDYGI